MNPKIFASEMEFVNRAVERKLTIPVLAHVKISQDKGVCTLTGTDLEIGAISGFPSDANVLELNAPATPLLKMLAGLNGDACDLAPNEERTKLVVRSGSYESSLEMMSTESFPELPKFPKKPLSIDVATLADLFGVAIHAISKEESRFTLNGALLVLGEGFIKCVATDGHRLCIADIPVAGFNGENKKILIPRRLLAIFPHVSTEGPCRFGTDENHVFFMAKHKNGNFRGLLGRKLTGNFPDYERVNPKPENMTLTFLVERKPLLALVTRLMKSTDKAKCGRFIIGAHRILLAVTNADRHETRDTLGDIVGLLDKKKDFEIGLHLPYVKDALTATDSAEVTLAFKTPFDAMTIDGMRGAVSVREIIMPMRL